MILKVPVLKDLSPELRLWEVFEPRGLCLHLWMNPPTD